MATLFEVLRKLTPQTVSASKPGNVLKKSITGLFAKKSLKDEDEKNTYRELAYHGEILQGRTMAHAEGEKIVPSAEVFRLQAIENAAAQVKEQLDPNDKNVGVFYKMLESVVSKFNKNEKNHPAVNVASDLINSLFRLPSMTAHRKAWFAENLAIAQEKISSLVAELNVLISEGKSELVFQQMQKLKAQLSDIRLLLKSRVGFELREAPKSTTYEVPEIVRELNAAIGALETLIKKVPEPGHDILSFARSFVDAIGVEVPLEEVSKSSRTQSVNNRSVADAEIIQTKKRSVSEPVSAKVAKKLFTPDNPIPVTTTLPQSLRQTLKGNDAIITVPALAQTLPAAFKLATQTPVLMRSQTFDAQVELANHQKRQKQLEKIADLEMKISTARDAMLSGSAIGERTLEGLDEDEVQLKSAKKILEFEERIYAIESKAATANVLGTYEEQINKLKAQATQLREKAGLNKVSVKSNTPATHVIPNNLPNRDLQQAMATAIFSAYQRERIKGPITLPTIDEVGGVLQGHVLALEGTSFSANNYEKNFKVLNNIRNTYFSLLSIPFTFEDAAKGIKKEGYIFTNELQHSASETFIRMLDYLEGALLIAQFSGITDEKILNKIRDAFTESAQELYANTQLDVSVQIKQSLAIFKAYTNKLNDIFYDYTIPSGLTKTGIEKGQLDSWNEAHTSKKAVFEDLRLAAGLVSMLRGNKVVATIHESTAKPGQIYANISDPLTFPKPTDQNYTQALAMFKDNHGTWLSKFVDENLDTLLTEPFPTSLREFMLANVRREQFWEAQPIEGSDKLNLGLLSSKMRTGFITDKDLRNEQVRQDLAGENYARLLMLSMDEVVNNFHEAFGQYFNKNEVNITQVYSTYITPNRFVKLIDGRSYFHDSYWTSDDENELYEDKLSAQESVAVRAALTPRVINGKTYTPLMRGTNHAINNHQGGMGFVEDLTDSKLIVDDLIYFLKNLQDSKTLASALSQFTGATVPINLQTVFKPIISLLEKGETKASSTDLNKALEAYRVQIYQKLVNKPNKTQTEMAFVRLYTGIQAGIYLKQLLNYKPAVETKLNDIPKDIDELDGSIGRDFFGKILNFVSAKTKETGNNEEAVTVSLEDNKRLLTAVFESIAVNGMGGYDIASCKSSADRFGIVLTFISAMLQFAHENNGKLLSPQSTKKEQEIFLEIFKTKLRLAHSENVIAIGNNSTAATKIREVTTVGITQAKKEDPQNDKDNSRLSKLRKDGAAKPSKATKERSNSNPDIYYQSAEKPNMIEPAIEALRWTLNLLAANSVDPQRARFTQMIGALSPASLSGQEVMNVAKELALLLPVISLGESHRGELARIAAVHTENHVLKSIKAIMGADGSANGLYSALGHIANALIRTTLARSSVLVTQSGVMEEAIGFVKELEKLAQVDFAVSEINYGALNNTLMGIQNTLRPILFFLQTHANDQTQINSGSQMQKVFERLEDFIALSQEKRLKPTNLLELSGWMAFAAEVLIQEKSIKQNVFSDKIPLATTASQLSDTLRNHSYPDQLSRLTVEDIFQFMPKEASGLVDVRGLGLRSFAYKDGKEDILQASVAHVFAHLIDVANEVQGIFQNAHRSPLDANAQLLIKSKLQKANNILQRLNINMTLEFSPDQTIRNRIESFAKRTDQRINILLVTPISLYEKFISANPEILSMDFPSHKLYNMAKTQETGPSGHHTIKESLIRATELFYHGEEPQQDETQQIFVLNKILETAFNEIKQNIQVHQQGGNAHYGATAGGAKVYIKDMCQVLMHWCSLKKINDRLPESARIKMESFDTQFAGASALTQLSSISSAKELTQLLNKENQQLLAHVNSDTIAAPQSFCRDESVKTDDIKRQSQLVAY